MLTQSIQNAEAVKMYSDPEIARMYVNGGKLKMAQEPEHQKEKFDKWTDFFLRSLDGVPDNTVLEVGAADGVIGNELLKRGFKVTESDAAPAMVHIMKNAGFKDAIKLDVLNDDIVGQYSAIIIWRVFVHFSPGDIELALNRLYDVVKDGGRVIFNVFNRKDDEPAYQEIDFDGPYHMGVARPYFFYKEQEIKAIVGKTKFKIVYSDTDGKNDKWLRFVIQKPDIA